jgi:hypothetical protein
VNRVSSPSFKLPVTVAPPDVDNDAPEKLPVTLTEVPTMPVAVRGPVETLPASRLPTTVDEADVITPETLTDEAVSGPTLMIPAVKDAKVVAPAVSAPVLREAVFIKPETLPELATKAPDTTVVFRASLPMTTLNAA